MPRFQKILVPTDFSPYSLRALPYAADLARVNHGRIVLAHFARSRDLPEATRKGLEAIRAGLADLDHDVIVEASDPVKGIVDVAQREGVDLIVMATHGRTGLARALMGSTAEAVVRHALCPVMVMRPDATSVAPSEPLQVRRILAPTDFSPVSLGALDFAAELARAYDAVLDLLTVVDETAYAAGSFLDRPDETDLEKSTVVLLHQRLKTIGQALGVRYGATVAFGVPREAIVAAARDHGADLAVLATHGRTGLSRLVMGSTAEGVVRYATCPVVTLRSRTAPMLERLLESTQLSEQGT